MIITQEAAVPENDKNGSPPLGFLSKLESINSYGRTHIPDFRDFIAIQPIGEGFSNPTYKVDTQCGAAQVLRAMPALRSAASAHRIDREFEVITALQQSAVPVPRPIYYCNDAHVAGTEFYLMDYVAGHVFSNGALPDGLQAKRRIYLALAECLGRLHAADHRALGLSKFGARSGNEHFERQIETMTNLYRDTEMGNLPEMEALIMLLRASHPEPHAPCIIHGDYRLGNVIVNPELDRIGAILDWEMSTIGDPLTDVGYCTLMYHWKSPAFGTVIGAGEGIPIENEFLETYCRAAGRSSLPYLGLYQALSLFRLACITQAALHRKAAGRGGLRDLPPDHEPAALARLALELAETNSR